MARLTNVKTLITEFQNEFRSMSIGYRIIQDNIKMILVHSIICGLSSAAFALIFGNSPLITGLIGFVLGLIVNSIMNYYELF